jgi:hypothetical protein
MVLLNLSLGDHARLERRACGCPLERLGWDTHLETIRSFEKLTAAGMNFLDVDVIRVLEEILPARFGGGPTDYQLQELITPTIYPGQSIERAGWRLTYGRLLEQGVRFRPLHDVTAIESDRLTVRHRYTGAEEVVEGVDSIVASLGSVAQDGLYRSLDGRVAEVHLIGDALSPRSIEAAVYDGHRVGREL